MVFETEGFETEGFEAEDGEDFSVDTESQFFPLHFLSGARQLAAEGTDPGEAHFDLSVPPGGRGKTCARRTWFDRREAVVFLINWLGRRAASAGA
jgi:hypothetical protein